MKNDILLKKNFVYNTLYQLLSVIVPILITPYVSRTLGADGLGEYSIVLSVANYFALFGILGSATWGQIWISKCRDDVKNTNKSFFVIILSRIVTFGIVIILYTIFISIIEKYRKMYIVMYLYLIAQFIDVTWFFQGNEDFKTPVKYNALAKIISTLSIFLLVLESEDVYIYAIILQGATIIANAGMLIKALKNTKFVRIQFCDIIYNIKHSIIYFIPSVALVVFSTVDKIMIEGITGVTAENGFYDMANRIYIMVVALVSSLSIVLLPHMAYLWQKEGNNDEEITSTITKGLYMITMIVIPVSFGLISISDTFVPLFFGDGYDRCIGLLKIIAPIISLTCLSGIISNQCIVSRGKQKNVNTVMIVSSIINVIFNLLLIPPHGSNGAAIASIISEAVVLCSYIVVCRKYINIREWLGFILKYFCGGLFIFFVIAIEKKLIFTHGFIMLGIEVVSGIVVYLIYLLITKDQTLQMIFRNARSR